MPLYNPPQLTWNEGAGLYEYTLRGGNVVAQLPSQMYALCFNDTGSTVTKGQVVIIEGAQGQRVAIKLALGDSDANSAGTIGLVAETIAAGAEGWVQTIGPMYHLDTSALTQGSLLFLSPTTAGTYTETKPQAPQHTVIIGYVERVHATAGSIFIKVDNGYELDELHNVKITTVSDGQLLSYDNTQHVWKNITLTPAAIGAEPADATILKDADIGVTVQAYNIATVVDASYVHTDNNYTTVEKSKLSGIAAGAEVNVNADWSAVAGDAQILNKPTIPAQFNPIAGTNVTLSGIYPNITFNASGGGGGGAGYTATAAIDLGTSPISETSVTITDANATATSYINVYVQADSTVDNDVEAHRHAAAAWQLTVLPATGSFTLYIISLTDLCWGTFKVRYSIA